MKQTRHRHLLAVGFCALTAPLGLATALAPVARAETSAQIARKPVVPPKPYRLPDGHLNWTGFWAPQGGLLDQNIGLGGTPASPTDVKSVQKNFPFSDYPPPKSPYKEQLQAFRMKMMAGKVVDPVALCFPPGMPRMMVMGYGMELLQAPGEIALNSEWQAEDRRVWLYRDTHPDADDLDPSYAGDSIGHWEGDTLVVDTIGIREDVPLTFAGLMHGPKLHVIERFTEKTPGVLVDAMTIEDPDVFATPWHTSMTYRYRPDLHLEEYVCLENNRNVGNEGEAKFSN